MQGPTHYFNTKIVFRYNDETTLIPPYLYNDTPYPRKTRTLCWWCPLLSKNGIICAVAGSRNDVKYTYLYMWPQINSKYEDLIYATRLLLSVQTMCVMLTKCWFYFFRICLMRNYISTAHITLAYAFWFRQSVLLHNSIINSLGHWNKYILNALIAL